MGIMDVEVRRQEAVLGYSLDDQHIHYGVNTSLSSSSSFVADRDASDNCRNSSMDNTRQTVNTHNSILDLTREDEEDDEEEDDRSVLFESFAAISLDEDDDSSSAMVDPRTTKQFSLNTFFGENFVDGLCSAQIDTTCHVSPEQPCPMSPDCSPSRFNCQRPRFLGHPRSEDRLTVATDIWSLLGCATEPGDAEIDEIWSRRVDLYKPTRANIKNRMNRIRQLRSSAHDASSSRHGVTLSSRPLTRSQTMDIRHDPLARFIGKGMEPIVPSNDGYDSDPEILSDYAPPPMRQLNPFTRRVSEMIDDDNNIQDIVQQTLNYTWTFTWHPNPQNVTEFGLESVKPICVNIWIERGTALPSGHVSEPTIMWRDAYQPHLQGKHQLNKSTQNPWTMRLLNTCRIAECIESLDRNVYPLARRQNCFLLKTSQGNHEFLFEAPSSLDVENVCERWKVTVARFASLAVTEDIDAIEREFFHPTSSSQMLIVDDEDF